MSTIRPLQSLIAANGVGTYTPGAGGTSATLVGMPPPTQASSGTSNLEVYDEGVLLTPGATLLNFTGTGVTASAVGTAVTVNVPTPTATINTQDEGVPLSSTVTTLNFVGAGITATGAGATTTVTVPAATLTTQDEGVPLSSTVNTLNFVGAGVTASGAGATTTVTIPGTGGAPAGFTTTVTATGTTTLTNTSTELQYFTGTQDQFVVLPAVSSLATGWRFVIVNNCRSLTWVQVHTSGGTGNLFVLTRVPAYNGWVTVTCVDTGAGTSQSGWSVEMGVGARMGLVANGSTTICGFGAFASDTGTTYGDSASSSGNFAVAFGPLATASAAQGVALGYATSATGTDSVCVGYRANANSIADTIVLNATGATLLAGDTAHAFCLGINTASVNPGSLGLAVNAASYQLPLYTSLYASTATAAGTTTLTVASARTQRFSGATTQTCVLPVVTTLANGFEFVIFNDSTGAVTVQSSGGNTITTLAAASGGVNRGGWGRFICVNTAGGTGVASWSYLSGATIL